MILLSKIFFNQEVLRRCCAVLFIIYVLFPSCSLLFEFWIRFIHLFFACLCLVLRASFSSSLSSLVTTFFVLIFTFVGCSVSCHFHVLGVRISDISNFDCSGRTQNGIVIISRRIELYFRLQTFCHRSSTHFMVHLRPMWIFRCFPWSLIWLLIFSIGR